MTPIIDGRNEDYIKYFSIEDYVNKIKLEPYVLEHLEETNKSFNQYLTTLSEYDQDYIVNYWIYLLYRELKYTQAIEEKEYLGFDIEKNDLFFNTLAISNNRINELHNVLTDGEYEDHYRTVPIYVGRNVNGVEEIIWRGAEPEDVERFMNDFIKFYKRNSTSLLDSNPFLKSALVHLLFIKIHPYTDGNGRTARMIQNIKFTDIINKIYGMRLKISPLNLSRSIMVNKITYANILDNIYFDIEHDNNKMINKWFDFMLNMVDEQLYMAMNKIGTLDDKYLKDLKEIKEDETNQKINKMRIRLPN